MRFEKIFCLLMAMASVFSLMSGCSSMNGGSDAEYNADLLAQKVAVLWEMVSSDPELETPENGTTVFFSICNRQTRAQVVHATGTSLEEAWNSTAKKAREIVRGNNLVPYWVKADVVTQMQDFPLEEAQQVMSSEKASFYRAGLSLDKEMAEAFLEAECNTNGIYDYKGELFSTNAIQSYTGKNISLPENVTLFVTQGYFCGEDDVGYRLSPYVENYGVRSFPLSKESAEEIVEQSMQYLIRQVQADGRFRYGYYAARGDEIAGYNALRHWGTVWSMIEGYTVKPSDELKKAIDAAVEYGIANHVVYRDDGTAFIRDPSSQRISVGGAGLTVIALCTYKDVFGETQYDTLLHNLGSGILAMSDVETGKYQHRWTEDFALADEFVTVYYDGEATFALCKLYAHDPNSDYLKMARKAVERFIAEDYAQYRDHWVAYSVNELLKYEPNERYYAFALQNIQRNAKKIIWMDESYFTNTELLMAGYDSYSRLIERGTNVKYLEEFDSKLFLDAINLRLTYGTAAFGYPEVVMYFDYPAQMQGCFFSRRDNFRARIDDTQHSVCGYINYIRSDLV